MFEVPVKGKLMPCLAPYFDMVNHSESPNLHWTYDSTNNNFMFKASRLIEKDEIAYISYGTKCNSLFFWNFAFINHPNQQNNQYTFLLNIDPQDPEIEKKAEILRSKWHSQTFMVHMNLEAEHSWCMIDFIRYIVFKQVNSTKTLDLFKS